MAEGIVNEAKRLSVENTKLRNEIEMGRRERSNLELQKIQIAESVQSRLAEAESETKRVSEAFQLKEARLLSERQVLLATFAAKERDWSQERKSDKKQINDLIEEVASLEMYRRENERIELLMKEQQRMFDDLLSSSLNQLKTKCELERSEKERLAAALRKEVADREGAIRRALATKAESNEELQAILKENDELRSEVAQFQREFDELSKSRDFSEAERRRLARDLEMCCAEMQEITRHSGQSSASVKTLQMKVKVLESELDVAHQEATKGSSTADRKHEAAEAELRTVVQGLQKELRSSSRELAALKSSSRGVLGNRSEMEVFFQESMRSVRREIEGSRKGSSSGSAASPAEFPFLPNIPSVLSRGSPSVRDSSGSARRIADAAEVDIHDLTWEERERVLRALFLRMNGAAPGAKKERSPTGCDAKGEDIAASPEEG